MGDFEKACAELRISLDVLPLATPKYNSGVERANKTIRKEFYVDPGLHVSSLKQCALNCRRLSKNTVRD